MPGHYALPCLLCTVLFLAPWMLDLSTPPPVHRLLASRPGQFEFWPADSVSNPTPRMVSDAGMRVEAPVPFDPGSPQMMPVDSGVHRSAPIGVRGRSDTGAMTADRSGRLLGLCMGLMVGLGFWLSRRRLGD